jgi:hypothetical protein
MQVIDGWDDEEMMVYLSDTTNHKVFGCGYTPPFPGFPDARSTRFFAKPKTSLKIEVFTIEVLTIEVLTNAASAYFAFVLIMTLLALRNQSGRVSHPTSKHPMSPLTNTPTDQDFFAI